jgi:predicted DCC family thiol-disulfide oxidoreductase YuxK
VGAALRALLSTPAVARAFYDAQCEVCQAFTAWLRVLDRRGRVECVPIGDDSVRAHGLDVAECLRQLHVVAPDGRVRVGWEAVAFLARRFPATWVIGALGAVPPLSWLARRLYRYVATNRFALSKCRGGACRVARPATVRRRAALHAFWTCYSLGMLVRAPIVVDAEVAALATNAVTFARTFRRRVDLLDGRLSLLFLGGVPCDVVPLVFGERFAAVLYDGLLVDPGSLACGARWPITCAA